MPVELIAGPLLFWVGMSAFFGSIETARREAYRYYAVVWLCGGNILGLLLVTIAVSHYSYSPLWGEYGGFMFIFWLLIVVLGFAMISTKPEMDDRPATDENSHRG